MKILQLLCFPLYGSGSGGYVRKLSLNLAKNGHQLAIVAPESREIKGIKIYNVKLPFMAVFTGHPECPDAKLYSQLTGAELNDIQSAFMDTTIRAVEEYKPDVIHVHHASNLAWIANYIKAVYQIHYVVTSHNTDIVNAIFDKRYIPLTQDALNRADTIMAVSKNTKDRLLKILGKNYSTFRKKTKVVSCGVDTALFTDKGSVANAVKIYHLALPRKVALYAGKITGIKGVDLFIKCAKNFQSDKFVVMGDGDEIQKMKDMVVSLKLDNVIFTGYLGSDDQKLIYELYRRADVVIVPSTVSEGVPLSALEAMSSGTAVIASNIGGLPTAVKNMKNGLLVKPRSVSALTEAVKQIFEDEKLKKRLGRAGRKMAVSKFDWSVIRKDVEKYYQVSIERSKKNRATKRPSFITEEEYQAEKEILNK